MAPLFLKVIRFKFFPASLLNPSNAWSLLPRTWGLRDYGIEGQIGLEASLQQFLNKLVAIFSEVKRVLKPNGVMWLNIGDGYTSGNRGYRAPDKKTQQEPCQPVQTLQRG